MMPVDVVIKALDVTSNTMLVFDTDVPLSQAQYARFMQSTWEQFKERGLEPIVLLTNGSIDVEKMPVRMMRDLRDRLISMDLGERHTCLRLKEGEPSNAEAMCRACADESA